MAVIMIAEVSGADASFVDGLVAAGVPDAMVNAPGFVSHISGITSSGFRVIEVWESRDAHRAWVDEHISPNLPPGMGPIPTEYTELRLEVPKRCRLPFAGAATHFMPAIARGSIRRTVRREREWGEPRASRRGTPGAQRAPLRQPHRRSSMS